MSGDIAMKFVYTLFALFIGVAFFTGLLNIGSGPVLIPLVFALLATLVLVLVVVVEASVNVYRHNRRSADDRQ